MAESQPPQGSEGAPYQIECHRSYLYRYVSADGTWVGLNGYGKIILSFFNDSPPLPRTIAFPTTSEGKALAPLTPQFTQETAAGVMRIFELGVVLSVEAAKALGETLSNFIKMAEEQRAKLEQK